MKPTAILWPVLVQVLLTVGVLIAMLVTRANAARELGLKLDDPDVRVGQNRWTEGALKAGNSYKNQFEMPVLFYVAALTALQINAVDTVMLGFAWAFALSRIVHAIIHIGPNVIAFRGPVFAFGVAMVIAMWLRIAFQLA